MEIMNYVRTHLPETVHYFHKYIPLDKQTKTKNTRRGKNKNKNKNKNTRKINED
jgi:hypothetical protein